MDEREKPFFNFFLFQNNSLVGSQLSLVSFGLTQTEFFYTFLYKQKILHILGSRRSKTCHFILFDCIFNPLVFIFLIALPTHSFHSVFKWINRLYNIFCCAFFGHMQDICLLVPCLLLLLFHFTTIITYQHWIKVQSD